MYEAFYGFKEKPFSMLPDPDFLFLSKKHQAALTLLEYGLLNHVGFCVISGEAGAGKTTILRALLERISDDITVGLITNTHQSFGGLLDWILAAFDLHQADMTHVEMHQAFMEYLIEEYANNRTVLLIVDEAQNMSPEALEELRMLSNVNTEKDQLMQVVLAGQPALKETLRLPELMQFAQRIAVDYHLDSLSLEETCGYIQHRLVTAGAQKDVFTPAACERIHTFSGGTPRLINLLCETVLVYGFADQQELIDVDMVDEMVLERMKDSVVPIVNRDVAKQDNTEASKKLEKDFPWIRPEGGTEGLKPSVNKQTGADKKQKKSKERVKPGAASIDDAIVKDKKNKSADVDNKESAHTYVNRGRSRAHEKKSAASEHEQKIVQEINQKPTTSLANLDDGETDRQIIKYGVIAVFIALTLILFALLLNDENDSSKMVNDEALELQKQEEQARLKQLQDEADLFKKERDAALKKIEEEKLAKQEAEKAAQAIKAAEHKRKLEEKKRIVKEKQRERRARQAEAKAREAEAKAKEEAAKIEEERRTMEARLEEEIRLKEQLEVQRLELELQEKQRQEALQEAETARQQAVAEEEAKKKKVLVECSGPTARFKAGCR